MQIDAAPGRFLIPFDADGGSQHTIRQNRRDVRLLARRCRDVGHGGDIAAVSHEDIAQAWLGERKLPRCRVSSQAW